MTTRELMRLPIEQHLPSGLLDGKTEFFLNKDQVYAISGGCLIEFYDWPEELYALVESDMEKHPDAIQALIELGIEERLEMIWQYTRCRFGSFDGLPDVDESGIIRHTEYWDCGFRGKCPYEGKLCASIKADHGYISWREIEIIKLVVEDRMIKEIADTLHISDKTVPVHLQNIYRKTGTARRGELIRFAIDHNIISIKN